MKDGELGLEDRLLHQPRFAPGLLACAPLFVVYELGLLLAGDAASRNGAEEVLGLALRPFGEVEAYLRWAILAALFVGAWIRAHRDEGFELRRALPRSFVEGALLAIVLGPLLLWMLSFFELPAFTWGIGLDSATGPPEGAPSIDRACRLVGAAAWEELLFRVGVYSVLYLVAARAAAFLGIGRFASLAAGDVVALVGSSAAFAAFHLDAVRSLLGEPGEPFDGPVFVWRLLAGLLLAGIYRWRGFGTAAWSHGLFNLGLALGAGPGVFLGA